MPCRVQITIHRDSEMARPNESVPSMRRGDILGRRKGRADVDGSREHHLASRIQSRPHQVNIVGEGTRWIGVARNPLFVIGMSSGRDVDCIADESPGLWIHLLNHNAEIVPIRQFTIAVAIHIQRDQVGPIHIPRCIKGHRGIPTKSITRGQRRRKLSRNGRGKGHSIVSGDGELIELSDDDVAGVVGIDHDIGFILPQVGIEVCANKVRCSSCSSISLIR